MQPFRVRQGKVDRRHKAAIPRGWLALVLALALVGSTIPQWESVAAPTVPPLQEVAALQGHGGEPCGPEESGLYQHLGCSVSGNCSAWSLAVYPVGLDFSMHPKPETEVPHSGSIPRPRFHPPKLFATI